MRLETVQPRGVFRARVTRDATALKRDGQVFLLIKELPSKQERVFEICFADGFWMLVSSDDLEQLE